MQFGRFHSFEDFIDSYTTQENEKRMFEIGEQPREVQPEIIKKTKDRDVVEIISVSNTHLPDESGKNGEIHYHIIIELQEIKVSDPDVADDMNRCITEKAPVFVAVRYGDAMGISKPINTGLGAGSILHIKGIWITQEKAQAHGGKKMSVLHFTHHPVGFICTNEQCYS